MQVRAQLASHRDRNILTHDRRTTTCYLDYWNSCILLCDSIHRFLMSIMEIKVISVPIKFKSPMSLVSINSFYVYEKILLVQMDLISRLIHSPKCRRFCQSNRYQLLLLLVKYFRMKPSFPVSIPKPMKTFFFAVVFKEFVSMSFLSDEKFHLKMRHKVNA